jgi:hypothetical protein
MIITSRGAKKITSTCIGYTPFLWYNIRQKFKLSLYLRLHTRGVQGHGGKDPCNILKQIPLSLWVLHKLLFWLKSFTQFISLHTSNIHPQKSTTVNEELTRRKRQYINHCTGSRYYEEMLPVAGSCDWNGSTNKSW